MSNYLICAKRMLTGREARRASRGVAWARMAAEVGQARSAIARAVRTASKACKRFHESGQLVHITVNDDQPLGISVPATWIEPDEGVQLCARTARFWYLQPSPRSPLWLPEWSIDNSQLSQTGARFVSANNPDTSFSRLRQDLIAVLDRRYALAQRLLLQIPRDATVAEALDVFPDERDRLIKLLSLK